MYEVDHYSVESKNDYMKSGSLEEHQKSALCAIAENICYLLSDGKPRAHRRHHHHSKQTLSKWPTTHSLLIAGD